jgi:hypothetical protein
MSAKAAATAGKAVAGAAAKAGAAVAAAAKGPAVKPKMPDTEVAAALGFASAAECLAALAPINAAVGKELAVYETLRSSYPVALNPSTGTFTPVGPLPDRPPPGAPKLLRKKFRAFPYWRNRPLRKWADFAPMVKELHVTYDPALEGSRGARELGLQARTGTMRRQWPRLAVTVREVEDGSLAVVMIKWVRFRSPPPLPLHHHHTHTPSPPPVLRPLKSAPRPPLRSTTASRRTPRTTPTLWRF